MPGNRLSTNSSPKQAAYFQPDLLPNGDNPFWFFHRTGSGNIYPWEVGYRQMETARFPYDRELTTRLCMEGCGLHGRNGGCPPYSPDFDTIRRRFLYGSVVYVRLYTRFYPPKVARGSFYIRWNFVKAIMDRAVAKAGKCLAGALGGILLGAGPCRQCGMNPCALKIGLAACRNPSGRVFSLEATGVLATELMPRLFGIRLYWFHHNDPSYIPEYVVNVFAVVTKEPVSPEAFGTYVHRCFDLLPSAYLPGTQRERSDLLSRDWRMA